MYKVFHKGWFLDSFTGKINLSYQQLKVNQWYRAMKKWSFSIYENWNKLCNRDKTNYYKCKSKNNVLWERDEWIQGITFQLIFNYMNSSGLCIYKLHLVSMNKVVNCCALYPRISISILKLECRTDTWLLNISKHHIHSCPNNNIKLMFLWWIK